MQISPRKTWSQEVLSAKLHLSGPKETGFFTYEKRSMLLTAVKTALAAGLCYWLATLAHLQDGYWGSISAIIVLQSNVGSTVSASRDRLIGTLIGAAFGAVFSFLGEGLWVYLLAVIAAMVTCSLLGLKNSSRLAGVTVTILMLVHRTGSNWILPLHRVLEVLLGIVVALGISALVLPDRARTRLRDGLAQEYLLMGSVFEAVLQGFRGMPSEHLPKIREELGVLVLANGQLLDAARNEPSSGPASLEGLSLLYQFGRTLEDSLHALELAVQDSKGDAYAAHLEPELGKLATDIHQGFQYVAKCIHQWKFDAPTKLFLKDSIAALEAKMTSIRPTSFKFPEAEILRAYAVQLHLKQLAQLLRASRIDTGEAVEKGQ
ncbi:FUSC family protein [Acidicapsa ligni]|uniref:FUSC family protein n=1 Tax=Acidicapsa ligni TaxID=542300 RepID=UPI0021E0271F|nr:FUSC family protein [Acidicapsa ligni]